MQDTLLNSLVYVSRYYGLANSPEALINGLPLADGQAHAFSVSSLGGKSWADRKRKPRAVRPNSSSGVSCGIAAQRR